VSALALGSASALRGQDSTQASQPALTISAGFAGDRFIGGDSPIALTLSRGLLPGEGRIAVVIGATDISAIFDRTVNTLTYRSRTMRLPAGENELVAYLVKGAAWTEVGRVPIRVLANGGFTTASTKPSASLNMKGQLAEGHSSEAPAPDRPTYQDFALSAGLQSAHTREGGFALRTQSNFLGSSRREEALRYALEQDEAPRFDLADFQVQLERGRATIALGHVTTGSNRHVVNGFASRGVTAGVRGGVANLSLAALNGSSIVGWDNLSGLDDARHRVYSATLGLELLPRRPGAVHLDATLVDGSLLPLTSFTQGAVVDAEQSTGGGIQLAASTPSQRLRVAAGISRSRFDTPNRDPQLEGDTALVPVTRDARGARYVELNAGLLQNAAIAKLFSATLNAGYRHERVDPLYRSVVAFTQADRQQNAFDLNGSVGAVSLQLSHSRGNDNLGDLESVLTTQTRLSSAAASVPLGTLLRARRRAAVWPQLSYGFSQTHQFGEGIPPNSDFSASHVPDQMSIVHDASAGWQAGKWRLQFRYNRSFQDNRQTGREQADLVGTASTVSVGYALRDNLDLSVDAGAERQSNRELLQNARTRRVGTTVNWRPTPLTTVTAFGSVTSTADEPATNDADNGDVRLELARGFDLWRNTAGGGSRGQLFLRYANQSARARRFSTLDLTDPPTRTSRDAWNLSSGASLRVF
jgi:hypothetical protein